MGQQLGLFHGHHLSSYSFEAFINYLGGVEIGKSPYEIVVKPNCIIQGLTIILPHYSFAHVLLHSLLLYLSVSSSSVLLCCPYHFNLPLVTANQCYDVAHVDRIHHNPIAFPFKVVKHDVIEVDLVLKGCSVLMLDLQILINFASVGPNKELVYPLGRTMSDA